MSDALRAALAQLRARIARAGRDPDSVTVVGVTKGLGLDAVDAAIACGLVDLGESYAQEMKEKVDALDANDASAVRWHFIGRLQTNKVRLVAGAVTLWQSVDRHALAAEIAKRAPGASVLVQVNTAGEVQKGGCPPGEAPDLVAQCRALGLDVQGLMCVGPAFDPSGARAAFRALGALADRLDLRERSMGMSDDLDLALEEGSTMIRVGTALFGARPARPGAPR